MKYRVTISYPTAPSLTAEYDKLLDAHQYLRMGAFEYSHTAGGVHWYSRNYGTASLKRVEARSSA